MGSTPIRLDISIPPVLPRPEDQDFYGERLVSEIEREFTLHSGYLNQFSDSIYNLEIAPPGTGLVTINAHEGSIFDFVGGTDIEVVTAAGLNTINWTGTHPVAQVTINSHLSNVFSIVGGTDIEVLTAGGVNTINWTGTHPPAEISINAHTGDTFTIVGGTDIDVVTALGVNTINFTGIAGPPFLTDKEIGFGSVTDVLTSSQDLTWDGSVLKATGEISATLDVLAGDDLYVADDLRFGAKGVSEAWEISHAATSIYWRDWASVIYLHITKDGSISFGRGNTVDLGSVYIRDTIGSTQLIVRGGQVQSTDNMVEFRNAAGTVISGVDWEGNIFPAGGGGTPALTDTYVGYGSAANELTGDATFVWEANTLFVNKGAKGIASPAQLNSVEIFPRADTVEGTSQNSLLVHGPDPATTSSGVTWQRALTVSYKEANIAAGALTTGRYGLDSDCNLSSTDFLGTISDVYAIRSIFGVNGGGATGIITNAYGLYVYPFASGAASVGTVYSIYLRAAFGANYTTQWGIYQDNTLAPNYFGSVIRVTDSTDRGFHGSVFSAPNQNNASTRVVDIYPPTVGSTVGGSYQHAAIRVNFSNPYVASGIADGGNWAGIMNYFLLTNASFQGTLSYQTGIDMYIGTGTGTTGTVNNVYGIRIRPYYQGATVTNFYNILLDNTNGGNIGTLWGIYQNPKFSRNYFGSNITISDNGISPGWSGDAQLCTSSLIRRMCVVLHGVSTVNNLGNRYISYCPYPYSPGLATSHTATFYGHALPAITWATSNVTITGLYPLYIAPCIGGAFNATITTHIGAQHDFGFNSSYSGSTGKITTFYNTYIRTQCRSGANITTAYGIYLSSLVDGGGVITTNYGIYAATAAQKHYFAGDCSFGNQPTSGAGPQIHVEDSAGYSQIRVKKGGTQGGDAMLLFRSTAGATYSYVRGSDGAWVGPVSAFAMSVEPSMRAKTQRTHVPVNSMFIDPDPGGQTGTLKVRLQ